MKKLIINPKVVSVLILSIFVCMTFFGSVANAQSPIDPNDPSTWLVFCNNEPDPNNPGQFLNPCTFASLVDLARRVIRFLILISIPLAAISFAWAGTLYISAAGNPGKISKAHEIFKKTLIGFVFILAAWLIVYTIINALVDNSQTNTNINLLNQNPL